MKTDAQLIADREARPFATPCRGLEYAGEQARLVYAGVQPLEKLMPGVG